MGRSLFIKKNKSTTAFTESVRKSALKAIMKGLPSALELRKKKDGLSSDIEIYTGKANAPFWTYDQKSKKHIIVIPDSFMYNLAEKEIQAFIDKENMHSIFHEYGHALYSEVITEKLIDKLKSEDVPFDILNIFEDMRIENNISNVFMAREPIFKFCKIDASKRKTVEPENDFFAVLISVLGRQGDVEPEALSNPYYFDIKSYRERVIRLATTSEVVDLSIEFYNRFRSLLEKKLPPPSEQEKQKEAEENKNSESAKQEKKKEIEDKIKGRSFSDLLDDMEKEEEENLANEGKNEQEIEEIIEDIAEKAQKIKFLDLNEISQEELDEILETCELVSMSSANIAEDEIDSIDSIDLLQLPGIPTKRNNEEFIENESNSDDLIQLQNAPMPEVSREFFEEIKTITAELVQMIVPKKNEKKVFDNGDGINIPGIIGLSTMTEIDEPLFTRDFMSSEKMAALHIIYDASGSMSGFPDENGKKILFALNEIAKTGVVDIKLTISKVVERDQALYQTVEFPIDYKALFTIVADGDFEGLAKATQESDREGSTQKDFILYFTDGNVRGRDYDELKNLFESNPSIRKKAIGVYINRPEYANQDFFETLFDGKYILEDSPLECARKIVSLSKSPNMFSAKTSQDIVEAEVTNTATPSKAKR